MKRDLLRGILAGAAGTTALNTATYLDMALRGRPASTTPEQTVERAEALTGSSLSEASSSAEQGGNRRSGLGALLGIAAGLGTGAIYGIVRPRLGDWPVSVLAVGAGLGANLASVAPMAALGITDPRTWPASSWLMDVIPHLAYGVATAVTFEAMRRPRLQVRWEARF